MFSKILDLTFQHAKNLAFFVTIYKSLLILLKSIKGKEHNADSFISGLIGGYIVFGEDTSVNNQIVLYLLSRIVVGLGSLSVKKEIVSKPKRGFTIMASIVWGIIILPFKLLIPSRHRYVAF